VAFSKQNGRVVDQAATCGDVDDVFLDKKQQRVYISCGDGFIDIRDASKKGFPPIDRVATVSGARTSLFVPEIDRLFVAIRAQSGIPASIWMYSTISRPGEK